MNVFAGSPSSVALSHTVQSVFVARVFPGGNLDAGDGSFLVTATIEEMGLLLVKSSSAVFTVTNPPPPRPDQDVLNRA